MARKKKQKQDYKEKNLVRITGLWKRTSKNGTPYWSGKSKSGQEFIVFVNKNKDEKQPELVLYELVEDEEDVPF